MEYQKNNSNTMRTIPQFFEDNVARFGDNIYMWEKKTDKFEGATYKEIREQVYQFACGLLHLGINPGDRIALLSEGRNDWVVAELGILYTGAINVPLSTLLSEAEIKFRVEHSGARMIVVSKTQTHKIDAIRHELRGIEAVIFLDNKNQYGQGDLSFGEIKEKGKLFLEKNRETFEKRWKSVKESDYSNISYTSGTTAEPKGIILSHLNYYANVQQAYSLMDIPPSWKIFLFIPWDHSFAHSAGLYCFMGKGASIGALQAGKTPMETLKNIPINIKEFKPDLMFSVPAFAKNLKKNIESAIKAKGPLVQKMFRHALRLCYAYNKEGLNKGGGLHDLKRPLIRLYDAILFKKIRQQLGGNMKYFIGGGALLDIELQRFFYAIGVPIYQGYGLSEATPIISINTPYRHKLGSSGMPVKMMDIKICDEEGRELPLGQKGEIVIRGENVMVGYWKNETATKETIRDGWLHTGDMGYLDNDGFLYVLGRFKSLLIADDGEKYSPEGIEETIVYQSRYILQCMLYNNQNPYTSIFVVPAKEEIIHYLKVKGLSAGNDEGRKEALQLIYRELMEYRTGGRYGDMFPQRWMPAAIGIIDEEFTVANQMLNSMQKMVRGKVVDKYQDLLDFLYTAEGKNIINERNLKAMARVLE